MSLLRGVSWREDGTVAMLVVTPRPHEHVVREEVRVIRGKGFDGDHDRKSYYRGSYVPGREVSAITLEVLNVLGVEPSVVGDNLITHGIDLASLEKGDVLQVGDVLLERSHREHRPCETFRHRTSPEAFAIVSRGRYRGALFTVRATGTVRRGDPIRVVPPGT
ncbi:MAG: MOSC domain-containing protein [Rhodothermales bacterium]